jgi:3-oxoacyl-[acyl-carrier-protein] synthase-3
MAGEKALENAQISRNDVQCLINTSVCRDYLEPATASMVAGRMKLPRSAFCFDIANACLGFLNGIATAANMIELGQIDTALIVDGESSRDPVTATLHRLASPLSTADTFRDNFATLTLGSGAVAAVVRRRDKSRNQHLVKGAVMRSATEFNQLCLGNHTEMKADPHGLLVHGVGLAVETWPYAVEEFGWRVDQVDEFVCHQVSLSHFTHTFQRLELPLEKALLTFPYLGNVGPASLPLTLALGEAQGRIQPGRELCLFGVGSGLGCVVMAVSW